MMRFIAGIFENGNKYTEQARKSMWNTADSHSAELLITKFTIQCLLPELRFFCGYFEKLFNNLFLNKLQYLCFKALQYYSSINCLK